MMKRYLKGALGLTSLILIPIPHHLDAQSTLRPCKGQVHLLDDITYPVNCDLRPPQVLAAYLDGTKADRKRCHHAGGAILYDMDGGRSYCINIDY